MWLYDFINNNNNINSYDRRIANVSVYLIINLIRAIRVY